MFGRPNEDGFLDEAVQRPGDEAARRRDFDFQEGRVH